MAATAVASRRGALWIPVLQAMAAALLGFLHFILLLRPGLVMATDAVWSRPPGDLVMAVAGTEGLLRDAWRFPLAASALLSGSEPLSIVYTDSMPWLAVLAKVLRLDPGSVSVMGLCVLLSFVLQPVAMLAFLRACGIRRWEVLLAGTLLGSTLPAWLYRVQSTHAALASHWVLLLTLALAALVVRHGLSSRLCLGFAALGALAIGVHAYLWVMVAAVAAGGLLAPWLRPSNLSRILLSILGLAGFLLCSALAAWVLGYQQGGTSVGGFGHYSLNLLSPVIPQISGILGSAPGGGAVNGVLDATGGQYEGYNYLGAGILLLVLAAVLRLARQPLRPLPPAWRSAVPLGLAMLGLLLLALSDRVFIGYHEVAAVQLPVALLEKLNQIRASGRFFWPIAYLLTALALVVLGAARRRGPVAVLLLAGVGLQAIDVRLLNRQVQTTYSRPQEAPFNATPWRDASLDGRLITLMPPVPCAHSVVTWAPMSQFALAVLREGARLDGGPAARLVGDKTCSDYRRAILTDPQAPGSLRVLFRGELPDGVLRWQDTTATCRGFELGLVCGDGALPAASSHYALAAPTPLAPGVELSFAARAAGNALLGPGWSVPEPWGVWSEGTEAHLLLSLPPDWQGATTLALRLRAFVPPGRSALAVTVLAGERELARWAVAGDQGTQTIHVPPEAQEGGAIHLRFLQPGATSPRDAGVSADARMLGLGLETLRLEPR